MARILVNSKVFTETVRSAIHVNSSSIEIKDGYIVFSETVKLSVERVGSYNKATHYRSNVTKKYLEDVVSFMQQIDEQPIVIEFTEYMHTDIHESPEMNILSITKRFK